MEGRGTGLDGIELELEFEIDLEHHAGWAHGDAGATTAYGAGGVRRDEIPTVALVLGAVLAFAVGGVLQLLRAAAATDIPGLAAWLRDAALMWPVATGLLSLSGRLLRDRAPRDLTAWLQRGLVIAVAYAVLLVPAELLRAWLVGTPQTMPHVLSQAAGIVGPAVVVLLVGGTLLRWAPVDGTALIARRADEVRHALEAPPSRRPLRTRAMSTLLSASLVTSLLPTTLAAVSGLGAEPAAAAVATCDAGNAQRVYDVSAIDVILPFNRWGDVDKHGQIYVLDADLDATQYWWAPLGTDGNGNPTTTDIAGNRRLRPRPLVLRANEGECVRVNFTNRLDGQAPVPPDAPEMARPNVPPGNEGLPTGQYASIHVHGPSYDVVTSDGSHVGFNDDTTVAPGADATYYWRAPDTEGLFLFHDHATLAGSEADAGSNGHGLFGALAVEPAGSRWYDPVSGARLDTGTTPYMDPVTRAQSGELYLNAIIVPPDAPTASKYDGEQSSRSEQRQPEDAVAFREFVQISQDEIPGQHLQEADLAARGFDKTFDFGIGLGFNYGLEPLLMRQEPINRCPDCVGEETWLSSWPYGDPGLVKLASGLGPWYPSWHPFFPGNDGQQRPGRTVDPEDCGLQAATWDGAPAPWASCYTSSVIHAYQFDATKIRYAHAGPKETHVFHLHAHQWIRDSRDVGASGHTPGQPDETHMPESTTIDSQTFGPGETFTADVLFGAGSKPGTIGDSIFHCHLYPHFAEGFWALWRVHDVHEDGTNTTPDLVKVVAIQPLHDRNDPPQDPDEFAPGYPRFIPGQYGWRAPQPLNGVSEPDGLGASTSTVLDFVDPELELARRHVAGTGLDESLLAATQTVTISPTPVHEEQTITVSGADGGTFTLSDGATTPAWTTAPIDRSASAWAVESAIEAAIGSPPANVTVTAPASGGPWTVAFVEPAATDVPQMTADPGGLLLGGSSGGSVDVTTIQEGDLGTPAGLFDLSFDSETTTGIDVGATASDVENALEGLSNIADVAVTGAAGGPWEITLLLWSQTASLAITADDAGLTAGSVDVSPSRSDLYTAKAADVAYRLARERASALAIQNPGFDPGGPASVSVADPTLRQPRPGAPLVDPCPESAREVTYNVSIIQLDVVYNEAGWHDPQARILVLDEDVDAVLSGQKAPEPFFFRVNAGDCINFNLTNRLPSWLGNDDFLQLIQTNMVGEHIHLVKFDVTASDGASNGWNYQQAAYSEDQRQFDDLVLAGTAGCGADTFDGLDIALDGDGCRLEDPDWFNPQWSCTSTATCPVGQTIHERWYADYELRTVFTHDHHFPAEDQNRGYFAALVVEPAGMDVRDSFTGAFMQPRNDGSCLTACEANAVGTHVDLIGPGPNDDFREYGLGLQDFVSLYRDCQPGGEPCSEFIPGEEPIAAPHAPEAYPDDDPGVFGLNYRNAPFLLRDDADPAYVFSSRVHGDPETPLLQAYAGDPVRVRVIQGAQEEQHVLQLHGMRWREEPDDPGSPLVNAQSVGISEAFNFEIPAMECSADPKEDCRGDYLYSGTSTDDLWLGAWGLLRVFGKGVKGLLPLPDNIPPAVGGNTSFSVSGEPPPKAHKPGQPCPTNAPVRAFDVIAVDAEITYNHYGDHDPYGLVYAVVEPGETVEQAAARVRSSNPEPMVLRASEGDCIEVTLTNMIDPDGDFATVHGPVGAQRSGRGFDPPLVLESPSGTPAGLRVSLHPQLLLYDVRYSDGATIGHNRDQTVGPRSSDSEPGSPGESITYRWYADDVTPAEIGAINLTDYGDARGHRHHGLFAGLVIGPTGSSYHDPYTGDEVLSAGQVDVRTPGRADFRDAALFFQDGLNLWDASDANLADPFDHPPADGEPGVLADAEDRGEKGFSYRNAPFARRLGEDPSGTLDGLPGAAIAGVFDSVDHGDPDTPIIRAYAGDPLRLRLLQGADKPRQHSFQLSGHGWLRQTFDAPNDTETIGTVGGFSVGRAVTLDLVAGGVHELLGDFRYNCGVLAHHQSGGLWGITRVYDPPDLAGAQVFTPTALDPESHDDPRLGGTPLMPLEFTQVEVGVYGDGNTDGQRGNNEGPKAGIWVDLYGGDPDPASGDYTTALDRRQTDDDGYVTFQVAPGAYDVVLPVTDPTLDFGDVRVLVDHDPTTPTRYRADATTQAERPYGEFGVVKLADVTIDVFEDLDGDNRHEPLLGDSPLAGWQVTLTKGTVSHTGTTEADGLVTLDGLWPGTWTASIVAQGGRVSSRDQNGNGKPDRDEGVPFTIAVTEDASLAPSTAEDPRTLNAGHTYTTGVKVVLFNDAYADGARDADEGPLAGWRVELRYPDGSPVPGLSGAVVATTDASGMADLGAAATGGDYLVRVVPPSAGWGATSVLTEVTPAPSWPYDGSGSCTGLDCAVTYVFEPGAPTSNVTTIGVHTDTAWIVAEPFNDTDNDGVRDGNEKKLVGWKAELFHGSDPVPVGTTTTGNDGRAVFSHVLGPLASADARGSYRVEFSQPGDADLHWAPTPATSTPPGGAQKVTVPVSILPGETVTARRGFIQLGTVSVQVFHDLDGDGAWDGDEPPLANRNVRLLSRNGRTVLQTGATKSDGMRAFQVAAGTEYQLEVLTPTGWVATAPKAKNGQPTTVAGVTSPTDPKQSTDPIEFGQRQTVDTTPPPTPEANPPGAQYTGPQNVSLTSETGATIRYTTDGSTPTTSSTPYSGSITLSVDTTLKAIAIDAAGNVSGVMTQSYTFVTGGGGESTTSVWLASWQVEKGTQTAGAVSDLQAVDERYVVVDSVRKGKGDAIHANGTANTRYTNATGLRVSVDGLASLKDTPVTVQLFDHTTATWRDVGNGVLGTSASQILSPASGSPPLGASRYVAANGDIRIRIVAERKEAFALRIDRIQVDVTYPTSGGTP